MNRPHMTRRVLALCLIAALLLSLPFVTPAAEAAALKEEVIYVRLFSDGSVDEVYVVNSFELDARGQIIDYGNYDYVRNLSSTETVRLHDGVVSIDTEGERLYYEGYLLDPELPWRISITYTLNGAPIDPTALAGRSGRLAIEIHTDANPRGSRAFFDTYCLQVSVSLDSELCRNVEATSGTIAAAGGSRLVSFVALPGKAARLSLSADVTDFTMPAITIAGVTLGMDFDFDDFDMADIAELIDGIAGLDDGVQELLDGVFDLRSGTAELRDGTVELADGVAEFADGIEELADGTGELVDGVGELSDGVSELVDGATDMADGIEELSDGVLELSDGAWELSDGMNEFRDGVGDLQNGTDELYEGFEELVAGAEELYNGAATFHRQAGQIIGGGEELAAGFSSLFDGILAMANAQLADTGLTLTRENYDAVLSGLLGIDEEAIRAAIEAERAQIFAGLLAAQDPPMTVSDYDALPADSEARQILDAMLEMVIGQLVADAVAQQAAGMEELAGLYALLAGYDALLSGLNTYVGTGVTGVVSGIGGMKGGLDSYVVGLNEYLAGFGDYRDGVAELYDGATELADGVNELAEGVVELLDGVIELRDGAIEFRDGVIELHDGVIELFDGMVELHDGVIELLDGVIELNDGVIELRDGTAELHDGVIELYDGVTELKDGTAELRENTATLDTDIVDGIKDAVEEMMGGGGPIKSFVSAKNGEIAAVQFVMQTAAIELPEAEETATADAPAPTLWQRFIRLFGFGD